MDQVAVPPPGSPRCWGRQYNELDKECQGCSFALSCKPAYNQAVGRQMSYTQPYQPSPYQQPQYQVQQYGLQPAPYWAPPAPPARHLQMYQAPPSPMWQQPAAPPPPPPQPARQVQMVGPAPAPYPQDNFQLIFGQYPGETITERLGKNIMLRALEAIFTELVRFFHYWTWPKLLQT